MRAILALLLTLAGVASAVQEERRPARVELQSQSEAFKPGEEAYFDLTFHLEPGFHIYAQKEALPESVREIVTPSNITVVQGQTLFSSGQAVWLQEPHDITADLGGPSLVKVPVYSDDPRVRFKVRLAGSLPNGKHTVKLQVDYQACTETICTAPTRTILTADVIISGGAGTEPLTPAHRPFEVDIFGFHISIDPESLSGMLLWLAMAALAGFVLNLMPCVLPMIAIKIEMVKSYAGSPRRAFWLGFMMFLGIVSFWTLLGALVAFVSGFGGISALFQTPAFTISAGLFMGVMGALMLRDYALELPGFLNRFNPMAKTPSGAFFFGVMQVIFATACAAPFMGSAVAWAMSQGRPGLALMTFLAAGIGMGLPLWLLTVVPHVRRLVPGGQWGVAIKKAMGLLMLGAACYFVGAGHNGLLAQFPFLGKVEHIWAALLFVSLAACMLVYYLWALPVNWLVRILASALGAAVVFGCVSIALRITEAERQAHQPDSVWQKFDPAAFERARSSGKIVIVDFTADWCINCKVLEQTVLHTEEIKAFVREQGVECFVADVTIAAGPGYEFMRKLGRGDPPLLVVYGPALPGGPIVSNAYSIADFKDYVGRAKGQ